ncbi:hypothetical protein RF55_26650, partial [Lasius niger]
MLRGIVKTPVETIGSITFQLLNKITKFHLISNEVPIPWDGLIGSEFLRLNGASLNYKDKTLIVGDMIIPFYEQEEIKIPARTVMPISFNVSNPEITDGYVPVYNSQKGLYTGGALVANSK